MKDEIFFPHAFFIPFHFGKGFFIYSNVSRRNLSFHLQGIRTLSPFRQSGISYPYRLSDSFKAPAELSTFKLEALKRKTLPMGKDTQ